VDEEGFTFISLKIFDRFFHRRLATSQPVTQAASQPEATS
jgi:hypothetical protein